ncbi:DNA cytosine methyltransferase [Mesomycoplasma ovipneumoniae]|uniref:DNA cytosine methyltransferase n=1 Tax=Mesomycoplasma ovipneumoniae TaxID=29562 RepID=UPI002161BED0|nr:DNA cytosine methyltransferase [Mesomycoplasma ovipneumoniae]UVO15544.1 DNA cytosine methyltransferase [Mesomycoplasma ovipneumoniae]
MSKNLKFIDLFSGIGGFRLALEELGLECVFSSEVDEHAIEMYKANFGDNSKCDITQLNPETLPNFDILCAGFPCQAFSISGKQKGFEDRARGTLFFDICRVLKEKEPKAFILENVQNLEKHDKGNTLFIMIKTLNELGYSVSYKVLNAKDFGVPQNRERIIIIGNKEGKVFDFSDIQKHKVSSMYEFLDKQGEFEYLEETDYTLIETERIKKQKSGLIFCGYRNKKIRTIGVREGTKYLSRVHKQPNRIYSAKGIHPTITSQEQSGRYFIYVDGKVRKLTLNECYKFMGFPNDFIKVGTKAKLYERIGNSVCVPMIRNVAKEVINQFWKESEGNVVNVSEFLEKTYNDSLSIKSLDEIDLTDTQKNYIKSIVEKQETLKGVYTVLVTSLVYKCLHIEQDIRLHQANMENGYSGRSFDTKYITPFMKQKQFLGAMKESGWFTRSLEQNIPYNLDFPGKINNKVVKDAFLKILNDIEENGAKPQNYLMGIFHLSIKARELKSVRVINPVERESSLSINEIIDLLEKHFYYSYKSRGASILPVVALYSVYECITKELKRFDDKFLQQISSHYSSDRSSGNAGDIVVINNDGSLYEVVEVKFDIAPDYIMVDDAYKKFCNTTIQRYYILSTLAPKDDELEIIHDLVEKIKTEHGCQVIINGVFPTLKYYLRLLDNTDLFMERYIHNIQTHPEINAEHKIAWNDLLTKKEKNNTKGG